MPVVPWGEWKPDVSSYNGSHTQAINNVLPRGDGYGPAKDLSAYSAALGATCLGAFTALKSDGSAIEFAGTSAALFQLGTDLAWTDVTRAAGGAYAVATDCLWSFCQSGATVVCVNGADAAQKFLIGTDTKFSALAGSPPTATYATMVGNHLVLSGLTATPYRIAWSASGDITGWTAGTNGSDVQDFDDGGVVRGVAGGEFGWVFQDGCIRRMTFVGGDVGFEFDRLTEDKGLFAPYSLTRAAETVFFLSSSGFEQLSPSGQILPIGKEKFDRTFYADWDSGEPRMMQGVYDPRTTRVWWFYKSNTGTTGLFNKAIVYDWALQRAAPVSVTGEYAHSSAQQATTLEQLASLLGFTNIDTMPGSLDDYPAGFNRVLGVYNTAHKLCFFQGSALEATLETMRSALDGNRRVFIRGHRPDTDATTVLGSVFGSQRLGDSEVQSTENALNSVGYCPHRVDTRIAGFRNRIPAGTSWTYSIGIEPDMATTGMK